jgi:hypothetical protein
MEFVMKEIPLSRGLVALVDDADFGALSAHKWSSDGKGYAQRTLKNHEHPGKKKVVSMHRVLLGLDVGDKRQVDHIDGNKANNQRSNLRICSPSQNHCNVGPNSRNKSGYKGVYFHAANGKWTATIRAPEKYIRLGYFTTAEAANAAYVEAAKIYHGEFANIGTQAGA